MNLEMQRTEAVENLSFREGRAPKAHDTLLELIKKLRIEGEDAISDRIPSIERADKIYRAYRVPDEDDKEAAKRGEPIKIVYPITFAQIQTGLAALMAVYNRRPFLELDGRGPQRFRSAKLMEAELQYEFDQMGWNLTMYLWLQDMFKCGFGKLNIGWESRPSYITKKTIMGKLVEKMMPGLALPEGMGEQTEKVIGYQGADLVLDDPKSVNFDPTVSIGDIQKAQFIFHTLYKTYNELQLDADEGVYFNVEGLKDDQRGSIGRFGDHLRAGKYRRDSLRTTALSGGNKVVLDICYIKLVPSDYGLSPLDKMQVWKIVMANENRIIQAEPSRFEHGMLPTAIIEYTPDFHELTNDGMAQTIEGMQEWLNWLLNSHQDSVRKVIDDVLIVDPRYINIDDIKNRRKVWRLKEGASAAGIERFVMQLKLQDVTQTHVADAARMLDMIQRTTGLSDNFSGIELSTVRTATEVSAINKLSAGRIKLLASLIFDQGLRPLGQQMIQNVQSFLEETRYLKVGADVGAALQLTPEEMLAGVATTGADLQGFYDLVVNDPAMPSDKMFLATKLQELAAAAVQSPMLAMATGLNLKQVMTQCLINYGFKNVSDFFQQQGSVPPEMMQMLQQQFGRPVQAQISPDERVLKQEEMGNLVGIGGPNGGSFNS